jgi:hypothetical protein
MDSTVDPLALGLSGLALRRRCPGLNPLQVLNPLRALKDNVGPSVSCVLPQSLLIYGRGTKSNPVPDRVPG